MININNSLNSGLKFFLKSSRKPIIKKRVPNKITEYEKLVMLSKKDKYNTVINKITIPPLLGVEILWKAWGFKKSLSKSSLERKKFFFTKIKLANILKTVKKKILSKAIFF